MNWFDDLRYYSGLQKRLHIAVVRRQPLAAEVLAQLTNAAHARAVDATPPVLLEYLANGGAA